MQPLRIGIIGYGGFGRFLHGAWSAAEGMTVVAVADADAGRDPGGVRFFADPHRMLADPGVDLVSIATPPGTHADLACAALEAGKHVLVEKPVATTREDALRIAEAQARTGCRATVNFMLRFNPIVEAVHAWCREGTFGRLRRVVVENYAQDEALPPEHWFWDPVQSGGILVEHAVHFIDIVHGCTSAEPVRVAGRAVARSVRQTDRVLLDVVYADGLVASQYHAFVRPGFFERTILRFAFDLADVEVEGWIPMRGWLRALLQDGVEAERLGLPGLSLTRSDPVDRVADRSRPEGWGEREGAGKGRRRLRSGGETYDVTHYVEGDFAVPGTKSEAYAGALRALMADFAEAVRRPEHRMRVTLADGIASLDVALRAGGQAPDVFVAG